jgi:hypothetical protein
VISSDDATFCSPCPRQGSPQASGARIPRPEATWPDAPLLLRVALAAEREREQGGPGPVESAVEEELAGLPAARERPGLAALAAALGRLVDGPVASAKLMAAQRVILDTLAMGSTQRRQKLAAVKALTTERGGAQMADFHPADLWVAVVPERHGRPVMQLTFAQAIARVRRVFTPVCRSSRLRSRQHGPWRG